MPIQSLSIENFAAFQKLEWNDHASLNVIVGVNDTGKTHLLKLLYAITRSVEEFWKKKNSPEQYEFIPILTKKLRWTFLPPKMDLAELITYHSKEDLRATLTIDNVAYPTTNPNSKIFNQKINFSINENLKQVLTTIDDLQSIQLDKSTFIPAKEVLSILDAIIATRESQELGAFDDTYYDLVKDYRQPKKAEFLSTDSIERVFQRLKNITEGGEIDLYGNDVIFSRGNESFNMHQTAEGIKKIGILSRLIKNGRFSKESILFIDEPETNLHPKAIVLFADILHELAQSGIQVYLTTHSYFLLKRLEQLARQHKTDYTLLDLRKQEIGGVTGTVSQLKEGLPMNPIVEESLNLFDNDVALDLGI